MLDNISRSRDALPSISHLDLDKIKSDKTDTYPYPSRLSVSTAPLGSPTNMYSGPPPPYSCASSTTGSHHGLSGYISPAESTTRRNTRDEKDSPVTTRQSLPSIHEALGEKSALPAPKGLVHTPTTSTGQPPSTTDSAQSQYRPFSQLPSILTTPKDGQYSYAPPVSSSITDPSAHKALSTPGPTSAPWPPDRPQYSYPVSPRASFSAAPRTQQSDFGDSTRAKEAANRSPYQQDPLRRGPRPSEYPSQPPTSTGPPQSFRFEPSLKAENNPPPFNHESRTSAQYGDTVKRHLDVYDAEVALNEVVEGSNRTLDFSRYWSQTYHQTNRASYLHEGIPPVHEIEDMMRQSQRVMDHLTRLRDIVVVQQQALSEERARAAARGVPANADYHASDDFKAGGFAAGDAKKRRGKAAPPGRCHSCNRAETPEWRRGPDGARTLCNACGLHYAKLTRKMGAGKASGLTGSNLRPKNLDSRV